MSLNLKEKKEPLSLSLPFLFILPGKMIVKLYIFLTKSLYFSLFLTLARNIYIYISLIYILWFTETHGAFIKYMVYNISIPKERGNFS